LKIMKLRSAAFKAVFCSFALMAAASVFAQGNFDEGFRNPSESMKPWCYWYWLDGEVTADGITKDLEMMAKVGIKRALIGNVFGGGPVKMLSKKWRELTLHAMNEAARVGVELMMFNGPGWSQSGGPWIKMEQSMRRIIWNEITAKGGDFSKPVRPKDWCTGKGIQDVAVIAFPRKEYRAVAGVKNQIESGRQLLVKSSWIWLAGENAEVSVPGGTRYFRQVFRSNPEELASARIVLTADRIYTLWINGTEVLKDANCLNWESTSIKQYLKNGDNLVAVLVYNNEAGPAGLIAAIELKDKQGKKQMVFTDKSWLASKSEAKGWNSEPQVPEGWGNARVLGSFPMEPWELSIKGDEGGRLTVYSWNSDEPFTARSLYFMPQTCKYNFEGKLYAVLPNGEKEEVAVIKTGGSNTETDFLPLGQETFSFRSVKSKKYELVANTLGTGDVFLNSQPMVAQVIEKQLGRMHPTPTPKWDTYIFPDSAEPDDPSAAIRQQDMLDLTGKLNSGGVLNCTLPEGNWTIIYFGMVTTGKENRPAPEEATGLECDKMSRSAIEYHFNSMFGWLLRDISPEGRTAFKGVTIDSYEVGSQNWTDGFDREFEKRTGYKPITLLPVLTGRIVDSASVSDIFLWDLRRIVADMIAENYVGGLRDVAHKHGMTLWLENYGHWGFPSEFLVYGGQTDMLSGEFWTSNRELGTIECRAASSAGHIYGKRRIFCEAFTSGLEINDHPYKIKARGEELFCEGVNHFVLHVYAHQPTDGFPGKNPWFGTAFHRNTAWFTRSRDWVKYLQRVHYMLQQGEPVSNVAVYIGDFAPQMTGPANPVPPGFDYDYMSSDALLRTVRVVNGEWVVYDENDPKKIAARYKLLAMPESGHIRANVLKRIEELKKAGGKVVNTVSVSAGTLNNFGILPIVSETTCPILWKARRLDDGMIFFLSNFKNTGKFEATLRVTGSAPEWFNPVTGSITRLARYEVKKNGTRICLDVKTTSDSFFIVFRDKQLKPSVTEVTCEGKDVSPAELELYYSANEKLTAESSEPGTYVLAFSDEGSKTFVIDRKSLSQEIKGPWNKTANDKNGYGALMETKFSIPETFLNGQRVYLDLGSVEVMAQVTLNGKAYDTLWMPPFKIDVTDVLKPVDNSLQVIVTSTSPGGAKLGETVQLKTFSRKNID